MQIIYLLLFTSPFQEDQRKGSFLLDHAGEHARAQLVVNLYFIIHLSSIIALLLFNCCRTELLDSLASFLSRSIGD